jgi:hypothetical protein
LRGMVIEVGAMASTEQNPAYRSSAYFWTKVLKYGWARVRLLANAQPAPLISPQKNCPRSINLPATRA